MRLFLQFHYESSIKSCAVDNSNNTPSNLHLTELHRLPILRHSKPLSSYYSINS